MPGETAQADEAAGLFYSPAVLHNQMHSELLPSPPGPELQSPLEIVKPRPLKNQIESKIQPGCNQGARPSSRSWSLFLTHKQFPNGHHQLVFTASAEPGTLPGGGHTWAPDFLEGRSTGHRAAASPARTGSLTDQCVHVHQYPYRRQRQAPAGSAPDGGTRKGEGKQQQCGWAAPDTPATPYFCPGEWIQVCSCQQTSKDTFYNVFME